MDKSLCEHKITEREKDHIAWMQCFTEKSDHFVNLRKSLLNESTAHKH